MPEAAGFEYISLKWDPVKDAEQYLVYVNDTRNETTSSNSIVIKNLQRSTLYSFKVASVNIAGTGNKSAEVVYKTSSISE